jgi:hypothetical protein
MSRLIETPLADTGLIILHRLLNFKRNKSTLYYKYYQDALKFSFIWYIAQ